MNKIKIIKIISILSFLLIVYPGKIAFVNFISLLLVIWNFFLVLEIEPISISLLIEPMISFITIISFFLFFNKKKYIAFIGLTIQYFYLFYTFNSKFIKHWEYTVPVMIYLMLTLFLIYLTFLRISEKLKL